MSKCKYCQKDVTWVKEGRKNVPLEADGATHDCEERKKMIQSARTIDPNSLSPEELQRCMDGLKKKR